MQIEAANLDIQRNNQNQREVDKHLKKIADRRPAILTIQGAEAIESGRAKYNEADQIAKALGYRNVQFLKLAQLPDSDVAVGIAILSVFQLWQAESRRFGNSQGVLSVKSPINFHDRLIIATAVLHPSQMLTPELFALFRLDPKLNPLYLFQGQYNLANAVMSDPDVTQHDLTEVPFLHEGRQSLLTPDQVAFRGIKAVDPSHRTPSRSYQSAGSSLVFNRFELPDEAPGKPQSDRPKSSLLLPVHRLRDRNRPTVHQW